MLKIWACSTLIAFASPGAVSFGGGGAIEINPPFVHSEAFSAPSSLGLLGMSTRWISIGSVVLFFTATAAATIFMISRAPAIEFDEQRRYGANGPRPTKLGRESERNQHRSERRRKPERKAWKGGAAGIANLNFTPNDPPEAIGDAARHLVNILTESERDLLRDVSDNVLYTEIKMGIHKNWQVRNPDSLLCIDGAENYEAYDADAVCDVIIETAQGLLSVKSGGDR